MSLSLNLFNSVHRNSDDHTARVIECELGWRVCVCVRESPGEGTEDGGAVVLEHFVHDVVHLHRPAQRPQAPQRVLLLTPQSREQSRDKQHRRKRRGVLLLAQQLNLFRLPKRLYTRPFF
jgi:hypothetical protein